MPGPARFALYNNAGLWSQTGLVGWLVQLPLYLHFFVFFYLVFIFFTNIVKDLFIPLAVRAFSFSNRFWLFFFFNLSMDGFRGLGFRNHRFWDGLQLFCLSIQGFCTSTGKNFVKNQPWFLVALSFVFGDGGGEVSLASSLYTY